MEKVADFEGISQADFDDSFCLYCEVTPIPSGDIYCWLCASDVANDLAELYARD
jgi:hypothetical protein